MGVIPRKPRCLLCQEPAHTMVKVGPDPLGPLCLLHMDEFMARLACRLNQPDGYHQWRAKQGLPPKELT